VKTTLLKSQTVGSGWTNWWTIGRAAAALLLALSIASSALRVVAAPAAADQLEEGIYAEETKGDLKAAIQSYQQVVEDPSASRSLVAQAQLRLGLCQLKLGNKPQAISALERLTREFPDRNKLLELVGQQMPQVLEEIVQQVERNYVLEVERGELMETAIRAILGKLDSKGGFLGTNELEFLGAREVKQFNEQLEQRLAGVGAVLKSEDDEIVVQTPLAGSPAFAAGLRPGDRLFTINGEPLPERGLETAVRLLRGQVGTAVTLGIKRRNSDVLQEIQLIRDTIRLPSVSGVRRDADTSWDFMLDPAKGIGYLRLSAIGHDSANEMQSALTTLQNRGLRALIFDLRNAPGGLLDKAVVISDLFVDSGRILTVKGRSGETIYDARSTNTFPDFPIALLVNRRTASAAEIIAGCLQDHGRALVIGERTAGHGIVRSLFQLKSGVGAVKLPVAAFYRPNGKSINRYPDSKDTDDWGITPDPGWTIALSDEELAQLEQDRAARSVLNGEPGPKSQFVDRQLEKAVEYIRTQLKSP
jgi:carboxyl-terminal processing protease